MGSFRLKGLEACCLHNYLKDLLLVHLVAIVLIRAKVIIQSSLGFRSLLHSQQPCDSNFYFDVSFASCSLPKYDRYVK